MTAARSALPRPTVARTKVHAAPPRRVRPSATSYRRRRTVVLMAVLATGALGVQGVLTGPGDVPASAAGTGTATPVDVTVRAEPGDTLWGIAQQHRGELSLRTYLDALIDRNGGSTRIQAGQLVHLP